MTEVRTSSPWRRCIAVLTALVVAVLGIPMHDTPARAEENSAIKFDPVTLTHVTETGEPVPPPGRQLIRGNFFFLDVSFDATAANPKPGDTFSISMPEPFVNRDAGNSQREVIKPLMVGATQAGDCNIKASLITCTLNEAVRGRTDIRGTLRAQLVAGGVTSRTSSTFVINGQDHVLQHPWGEDIVAPGIVPFTPGTRAVKGAIGVGSGSKAINWRVIFGGTWLKNNYPNGGPITIKDTISAGMEVPDPSTVQLVEVYGDPVTGKATDRVVAKGDGTGELDGFKVTPSFEGRTVTFKVEGPLSPEKDYRVELTTPFTGGETVTPGFQYTNAATFVEAGHTTPTAVRSYFESFKAIVTYKQGFGGFEVSKNIQGEVIPPRGQKFDVTVNYTLPAGTTAADYPDWKAPENPTKLTVTVGSTTPYMPTFPKGTVVTLSEDTGSADPASPGITWGAPVFSSTNNKVSINGDKTQATFTVEDQVTLPVSLMNTTKASPSGAFAISKVVVDGGSDGTDSFGIEYKCSAAGENDEGAVAATGTVAVTAGVDKVVGRFPVGTTCEVVSEVPAPRDGYSLSVDKGQAVTVVKDDTVKVNVTNTYTKDLGVFAISKVVVDGGSDGTDSFGIEYKCSAAGENDEGAVAATGTVAVTAGVDKVVGRFPVGTTCEVVSEVPAPRDGYSLSVDKGQAVTVVKDDTVKVNVTNTYTKDSAPSPGPSTSPSAAPSGTPSGVPSVSPSPSVDPSGSPAPTPSGAPTVTVSPTAPGAPTPTGRETRRPPVKPGLPRTGS